MMAGRSTDERLVHGLYDDLRAHDLTAVAARLATEVVLTDAASGADIRGRDAVSDFLRRQAAAGRWPAGPVELVLTSPRRCAVVWSPARSRAVDLVELDADGRVIAWEWFRGPDVPDPWVGVGEPD